MSGEHRPQRLPQNSDSQIRQVTATPLDPADQNLLLRKQAFLKANQGQHLDAIDLFDQLIERDPDNASYYNNRGLLYFQLGEYIYALDDYDCAIALTPLLSQVYNNRANCHAALGNLDEAVADYDAALDLNPADINAWINQGITFRDLDLYKRAIENFDIALQLNELVRSEQDTESLTFLDGHIYTQRARTHHIAGYWNWAIADYRRALRRLPPKSSPKVRKFYRQRAHIHDWLQELLGPQEHWGCAG
jgi:tetratricopeptide (TPR) repeat protein